MLVCLLLVSVRRAIIVRNSESVLDLLAIRCTIYETSPIGMVTTRARTVKNNYTAMLVAKGKQKLFPGTLLLRFVDATGTSIKFVVFGSAISQFSGCKLLRIYDVEIPNKCVRMSGDAQPHGVKHNLEVVLGDRCGLRVSNEAWPFKYPYEFIDWIKLDQLGADAFVDIIGTVIVEPSFDSNNFSPKLHVQLGNGDFRQDVEFLGDHANLQIQRGDVLALAGLRVRGLKRHRCLRGDSLTIVEINPSRRVDIPAVPRPGVGILKRKVVCFFVKATMFVVEAVRGHEYMQRGAQQLCSVMVQAFAVTGFLKDHVGSAFNNWSHLLQSSCCVESMRSRRALH